MSENEIETLKASVVELRDVLATFISWSAMSAASPISREEAMILLKRLDRIADAVPR